MVSGDGEWVYFSSARHAAREPNNPRRELYRASRASGWKTVERVTFTPKYGEVALSVARDGRGILWSGRPTGEASTGLYEVRLERRATSATPQLVIVADLTSLQVGDASGESFPVLSPDGSFLIFSNYDIDGTRSKEDLFITRRTKSGWSPPQRLAAGANSSEDDIAAQVVGDGRTLLFRSSRSPGAGVYRISMDAVIPVVPARR